MLSPVEEEAPVTLLSRLIRRAELGQSTYTVITDREEDLVRAEAEAEKARARDLEQREAEKKNAYAEGHKAGYEQAKSEIAGDVVEQVERFTSMVDDLVMQKKRMLIDSEEAVVKLSCQISRRIVGEMARVNEDVIREVVRNALGHLSEKQKVTIRVNPGDMTVLRAHKPEWEEAAGAGATVEIVEDVRIKRGGCLVEGESGSVEAELDRQVEMIEKALVEAVNAG